MALKPPGCRFQLTPSRRATTDCQRRNKSADISTHALTEGDSCFFSKIFFEIYFNSRPHGGRRLSRNSPIVLVYFNSRPHGGRLQPVADQIHLKNFNSRPHGGRREKSVNFPVWLISTHALTEGDEHGYQIADSNSIFQLTPSRRATGTDLEGNFEREYFNSRPHGGRRSCAVASRSWIYFNSRPHGGRLCKSCC